MVTCPFCGEQVDEEEYRATGRCLDCGKDLRSNKKVVNYFIRNDESDEDVEKTIGRYQSASKAASRKDKGRKDTAISTLEALGLDTNSDQDSTGQKNKQNKAYGADNKMQPSNEIQDKEDNEEDDEDVIDFAINTGSSVDMLSQRPSDKVQTLNMPTEDDLDDEDENDEIDENLIEETETPINEIDEELDDEEWDFEIMEDDPLDEEIDEPSPIDMPEIYNADSSLGMEEMESVPSPIKPEPQINTQGIKNEKGKNSIISTAIGSTIKQLQQPRNNNPEGHQQESIASKFIKNLKQKKLQDTADVADNAEPQPQDALNTQYVKDNTEILQSDKNSNYISPAERIRRGRKSTQNTQLKDEEFEFPELNLDYNKDGFYNDTEPVEPPQPDIIPLSSIIKVIGTIGGLFAITAFLIYYA